MNEKRAANRAFVHTHMPEFEVLFEGLVAAGMSPKLVKLEMFHVEEKAA